jgi:hypothetical protein
MAHRLVADMILQSVADDGRLTVRLHVTDGEGGTKYSKVLTDGSAVIGRRLIAEFREQFPGIHLTIRERYEPQDATPTPKIDTSDFF